MKLIPPGLEDGEKPPKKYLKKEIFYLPFYLFRSEYEGGRSLLFIVDTLTGKSVRVKEEILNNARKVEKDFPRKISLGEAKEIIMFQAKFPLGIFSRTKLKSLNFVDEILYPFIVYYKLRGKGYDIDVFDGISGKKENLFAKEMVIHYLMNI